MELKILGEKGREDDKDEGEQRRRWKKSRAEVGVSLSSRPAWSIEKVPGLPGLHREIMSKQQQQKDTSDYYYSDLNM